MSFSINSKTAEQLSKIQANIVKPHGRDHCWYLFFSISATQREKGYHDIRRAISEFGCQITSGLAQLQESITNHQFGIEGKVVTCFFISKAGHDKIFGESELRPSSKMAYMQRKPEKEDSLNVPWQHHMGITNKVRSEGLKFATADNEDFDKTIDFMVMIADDHKSVLKGYSKFVKGFFEKKGIARLLFTEKGRAIRKEGKHYEPFGYRDGLSGVPLWKEKNVKLNFKNLRIVLDRFDGSFVVFQKLEQQVKTFHDSVDKITREVFYSTSKSLDELRKSKEFKEKREFIYAQFIGRFRDGTPLIYSPKPVMDSAKKHSYISYDIQNFDQYDTGHPIEGGYLQYDPEGLKCPFFSHVRKVNVRDQRTVNRSSELWQKVIKSTELNRAFFPMAERHYKKRLENPDLKHRNMTDEELKNEIVEEILDSPGYCDDILEIRIERRGIPYKETLTEGDTKSKQEGLLFVSYQKDLCQFTEIEEWMDDAQFPGGKNQSTGVDPIVSRATEGPTPMNKKDFQFPWIKDWGKKNEEAESYENLKIFDFVRFKGGEYFYAPSMKWIQSLYTP